MTDPKSLVSPADDEAGPAPIEDLGASRGVPSAAWSRDGRQIFLSTNLTGRFNIWRADAAGSWPVQLTQSDDAQSGLEVSPDGKTLYFQQDQGGNEYYDLYAVPTGGGPVRRLTATPDVREAGMLVAPDGRIAITVKKKSAGQTDLAILDPATRTVRLLTREASPQWQWSPVAWIAGGKALIANRTFVGGTAGEVWRIDAASGHAARLMGKEGTFYAASDATHGRWRSYRCHHERRHGPVPRWGLFGGQAAYAERHVIQPNPRGSTGYGLAFEKANFQDLGGGDLKDEIAGKDFLVASGYVDPKRVGITGGSYGGYMTLMAIGRTPDAFAAAVEMYGIIDWRTMWAYEDSLLQAYQRTLLGSPDEAPAVYDATSPITYIQAVKAPLLVLRGENDIRVPAGQARQVVDALKAKGNVVDSVFYPAEGHGFLKRENRIDSLKRKVTWFDEHLKGKRGL